MVAAWSTVVTPCPWPRRKRRGAANGHPLAPWNMMVHAGLCWSMLMSVFVYIMFISMFCKPHLHHKYIFLNFGDDMSMIRCFLELCSHPLLFWLRSTVLIFQALFNPTERLACIALNLHDLYIAAKKTTN